MGRLTSINSSEGSITRTYDAAGRVTSCTDTQGRTVGYEYDQVGRISTVTYPDSTQVRHTGKIYI